MALLKLYKLFIKDYEFILLSNNNAPLYSSTKFVTESMTAIIGAGARSMVIPEGDVTNRNMRGAGATRKTTDPRLIKASEVFL